MINHFTQRISRAKAELIALAILAPLAIVLGALLLRWPDSGQVAELPTPTLSPASATTAPAAAVSLVIESPDGALRLSVPAADSMTAADVLLAAHAAGQLAAEVKDYGGELGIFVEALNGQANDPSNNQYWFLYINGTKSPVGASRAPVRAGDTVTWKYEKANHTE